MLQSYDNIKHTRQVYYEYCYLTRKIRITPIDKCVHCVMIIQDTKEKEALTLYYLSIVDILAMKFIFVMQHAPTADQIAAAQAVGEVVQLQDKKLLVVPDDANLSRDWFVQRAEAVVTAVGGIKEGDTLHCMGQQQLAAAINAIGRKTGAKLVESVTPRVSKDIPQSDGTVKKELVFSFAGFRELHSY